MVRGRLSHGLITIGVAAFIAVGHSACSSPSIEGGGDGSGGVRGGAGGNGPAGGDGAGGLTIDISSRPSTGGTGGSSGVCNSTSTAGCKAQYPEACGDGINNQGGIEACDDGNVLPGDGCNGMCKVEKNWTCPNEGKCTRDIVCGDGEIGAGEVCDDGGTADGDGCSADCTVQDPAFKCVAGQPCERVSQCGNKRIEAGENCDDGNADAGDGCSASCQVEGGYVCPVPGSPCKPAPRCGDGVVQGTLNEVCDDGNQKDGDGCAADCKSKDDGCICSPGQLCKCPTVKCGNGSIEGDEECDDGNTTPGDGCTGTCKVEPGYACPFFNAPCVPDCGDGIVLAPYEQCDPAGPGTNMDKACSSTCKYNPGWACTGNPPNCHETKCGDGKLEGSEGCDDGNTNPNDGCSPTCHFEPNCDSAAGTCTSKCGDGLVVNEDCDDGNLNDGDGCTHDCKTEGGWECNQPENTADTMSVPVTYRDFLFAHSDFEESITGSFAATTGLVKNVLDGEGKPAYSGVSGNAAKITSTDTFKQWYRDVSGTNTTHVATMVLHNNGQGGYVNWWKDDQQYLGYTNVRWCSDGTCGTCNDPPYVDDGSMRCFAQCAPWGADNGNSCVANITRMDGNPLFFPLDNVTGMITPTSEYTSAKIPPSYGGDWADEEGKPPHNFAFTSEVRYWFSYIAKNNYTLEFTGDDDVWVFVNRKLAVDLGGIHTPVNGKLVLNATGGGTVTVTQTEGEGCTTVDRVTTCPPKTSTVDLGMQDHGVYEIVVFQAERQTTASTYKLTLSGFNDKPSECGPICGDGVVAPGEQCDNGDRNQGGYNECTAECRLGPYCGDAKVEEGIEECDNGENDDEYGLGDGGCGPDCKVPGRCGDGVVQSSYDEECDDGDANLGTTDPTEGYGGCMANCRRGGYCGDGQTNGAEQCDDGANDGTYGTCNPDCTPAPKCGDGEVQEDYGEECEPAMSDDPSCTEACRLPGGCGDGKVQPPEQCDNGELFNNGEYGGCAPSCIFAPHCGDGIPNGPEDCDDGILDGTYGGCTPQCKLAPHCGDGILNGPEECDDGPDNGKNGACTAGCKTIIYLPP